MSMHVGTAKVIIRLPENDNLKGKRQVVKSLTARLRERFNIAVAEVDNNDEWQILTIGMCLCYHLPVLNAILDNKTARALYVYPTKALAQDQLRKLGDLTSGGEKQGAGSGEREAGSQQPGSLPLPASRSLLPASSLPVR